MLFYFCGIRCTISVSYLILSVCGVMHVTQTCNACLRCVWVHVFVCMCVDGGQRLMLGISFECPLFYLWTNNLSLNPILASQLALLSSVSAFWVLNLHRWVTKSPGFYVGAGGQSFNFHAFVPSTFLLELFPVHLILFWIWVFSQSSTLNFIDFPPIFYFVYLCYNFFISFPMLTLGLVDFFPSFPQA